MQGTGAAQQMGGSTMKSVQRTRGIMKVIREAAFGTSTPKYVTAGNLACGQMMQDARSRRQSLGPSDAAILAWAKFDLAREIMGGFWEVRVA